MVMVLSGHKNVVQNGVLHHSVVPNKGTTCIKFLDSYSTLILLKTGVHVKK